MKHAFNDNGTLRDVVMTHPSILFSASYAEQFIEVPDAAYNGCLWDGQTVSDAPAPTIPPGVPQSITPRQARLALLGAGLLETVQTAFAEISEPQRTAAQIEWDYALTIERGSPLVAKMAAALGMTDGQVDALFVAGAAL